MTIKTTYLEESVTDEYHWWNASTNSCEHLYSSRTASYGWTQVAEPDENSVQHRPKPSPLYLAQTDLGGLGVYYTFTVKGGLARVDTPSDHDCGVSKYHYIGCLKGYPPFAVFPPVNWSLGLAERVKNLRVNLAGDIAEMHETVRATSGLLTDLAETAKKVRDYARGRYKPSRSVRRSRKWQRMTSKQKARYAYRNLVRKPVKQLASGYLGVSFGWEPTLGTVDDLVAALNARLSEPVLHVVTFGGTESVSPASPDPYGQLVSGQAIHTVRGKYYVRLQPSAGFATSGNPAEWLWENVPFSHVVDWAVNVGQNLTALDAYLHVVATACAGYALHNYRSDYSISNCSPAGTVELRPARVTYSSWWREAITGIPETEYQLQYEPSKSVRSLANAISQLIVVHK